MKQHFIFFFLIPLVLACSKKGSELSETQISFGESFKIIGDVSGLPDTCIVELFDIRLQEIIPRYSLNGKFEIDGSVEEPTLYDLTFYTSDYDSTLFRGLIFVENTVIKVNGAFTELQIEGSQTNDEFNIYREYTSKEKFYREFPGSFVTADNLLWDAMFEKYTQKELQELYSILSPKIQQSIKGEAIKFIANNEFQAPTVGDQFIDFRLENESGNVVSISSLRKKYTLIDFWATWCPPCLNEQPYLKDIYEKYHPLGLEIIGVSFNHDKERWKAHLEKEELKWPNLIAPQGRQSKPALLYRINGIPRYTLIDEKGKILGRDYSIQELEEFLSEELGVN